jgi:site-specific recombinase XerD
MFGVLPCSPRTFHLFCKLLPLKKSEIGSASMAKASFIVDSDLKHLFKVAAVTGDIPIRNVALIMTMYGTGMKLTEVARLPVSRYLSAKGDVLEDSEVPTEIAYNGKVRPLHWTNAKVIAAIDKYLTYTRV